ncbi:MAG: matrixin family metalloprotease [Myxococcota bacterium]
MSARGRAGWALLAGVLLAGALGCPPPRADDPDDPPAFGPDRRDYTTFAAGRPEVVDPNYLPFMLHYVRSRSPRGYWFFFCRWSDDDMPLRVYIDGPEIPDSLQDEFRPVAPAEYQDAVARAFSKWEKELEGRVRFRRVEQPDDALLVVRIKGEPAPETAEGLQVLGATESLIGACEIDGQVGEGDAPLPVRFRVPDLDLYVADRAGLLTAYQVEMVAVHELGHALGMKGHSPLPDDFLYPAFRDQASVKGLSQVDINSFLSLYSLPNGTRYAFVPEAGRPPPSEPRPPTARPVLGATPHVDPRLGFDIELPADWMRVVSDRGVFAANGPVWDRDVSIEIGIWPYADIRSFLGRFNRALFEGTRLKGDGPLIVAGRPALWIAVSADEGRREQEFLFVELGDGRLMMLLSDSPAEFADAWRPWFRDILASLEIWSEPGVAR